MKKLIVRLVGVLLFLVVCVLVYRVQGKQDWQFWPELWSAANEVWAFLGKVFRGEAKW